MVSAHYTWDTDSGIWVKEIQQPCRVKENHQKQYCVELPGRFHRKKKKTKKLKLNPGHYIQMEKNERKQGCKFNQLGTRGELICEMVQSRLKERDLEFLTG